MEVIPNPPILIPPPVGPVPASEPVYFEKPPLSSVILAGATNLSFYISILLGVGLAFYFLYVIAEYLAPNAMISWGINSKRGAKKMHSHHGDTTADSDLMNLTASVTRAIDGTGITQ